MSKNNIQTSIGIDFKVNQAELNALKRQLQELQKLTTIDLLQEFPNLNVKEAQANLESIRKSAPEVQQVLSNSFNVKLNHLNMNRLQKELKALPTEKIYEDFSKAGAAGIRAFNSIPSAIMKTNLQLRESHGLLDRIGKTMTNTIKWGITSSVFNRLTESLQGAWGYAKALDTSLNDIRIVTGYDKTAMASFAKEANKAAKELKTTTGESRKMFLGHTLENGKIKRGFACGINNENVFCIEGSRDGSKYEDNVDILRRIFGDDNCEEDDYFIICKELNF